MRSLFALMLSVLAPVVRADDMRPLYVEARLDATSLYAFTWRTPPSITRDAVPDLVLPEDCVRQAPSRHGSDGSGHWREASWRCGKALPGRGIVVRYPRGNPGLATILKVTDGSGASRTRVSGPGVSRLPMPVVATGSSATLPVDYLALGVEHIWLGFDHLLFVACLIWIAGSRRRILATVTGFTLAHSVTLALASLGVVAVPVSSIEVLIALSIVFLAVELARNDRTTITWCLPISVSTGFGLLHGFGFAAALNEIGLPRDGLVGALLAFNAGIEIGQLLFVACVAALTQAAFAVAGRLGTHRAAGRGAALQPDHLRLGVAYTAGITATYWMLERAARAAL